MCAGFVEIRFLKLPDLHGRIHQAVIIFGAECSIRQRRQRRRDAPSLGHTVEARRHRRVAGFNGIHQNLRQIEKGVVSVQFRAERTERIHEYLILNDRAVLGSADLPEALVQLADR